MITEISVMLEVKKMLYYGLEQYTLDRKKALAFGFRQQGGQLMLVTDIAGTEFYAKIIINVQNFEVNVFDKDTDEEYLPFNVADNISGYVNHIREKVEQLLQKIKTGCFYNTNVKDLLMRYCRKAFGTVPEAPWEDTPDAFTFKTGRRNKWYAVFMTIPYKSIGLQINGRVDIVNFKLPPEKVTALIDKKHFYPAYHMNKKHWLTAVLSKNLDIELVKQLLAESYHLVER